MKKINNEKKIKKEKNIELKKFIKKEILGKTKVLTIVGIALFVLMILLFSISDVELGSEIDAIQKTSLLSTLKNRGIILLLILLAGWVPYFYIPIVAYIAYMFMLSGDVILSMESNGMIVTLLLNILPVLFDIITVSIIASIGTYMCNFTTKKYIYTQSTSFSFIDVKIQLYQMTKKQDKYEAAVAKKQEKIDKMNKNDVKIDYANILRVAPSIIILNIFVCMIQYCIN